MAMAGRPRGARLAILSSAVRDLPSSLSCSSRRPGPRPPRSLRPRSRTPSRGEEDLVEDGRGLFNQYCAHCHGPNAIQGERPRDLRRLKVRYGQEAPQVYYQVVNHGRLDKGMPVWKGVLSEDALWRIFTYLQTVQTPP